MTTKSTAVIPPDPWRDIAAVKRELRRLNFGPLDWLQTTDARITAEYTRVVQAFQREHGLTQDGIVGPLTWAALRDAGKPAVDLLQPLRDAAASCPCSVEKRAIAVAQKAVAMDIHEHGGKNRGPHVEAMQKFAGGGPGDAWCAAFCDVCLRLAAQAAGAKLAMSIGLSCSALVKRATKLQRVFEVKGYGRGEFPAGTPQPGDLLVLRGGKTGYKHVGLIIEAGKSGKLTTIEGNTNNAGDPDGDGVYLKHRDLVKTPAVIVRAI